MKICYLDANLLVFIGNKNSPFHKEAVEIIKKLRILGYELTVSSLSLDEYFHTVLRFSKDSKELAINNLKKEYRKLIKINIKLINPSLDEKKHLKVIDLIAKYNLHPRDAYHLFIMLANKVKFLATFDNDLNKVFKKGLIKQFI